MPSTQNKLAAQENKSTNDSGKLDESELIICRYSGTSTLQLNFEMTPMSAPGAKIETCLRPESSSELKLAETLTRGRAIPHASGRFKVGHYAVDGAAIDPKYVFLAFRAETYDMQRVRTEAEFYKKASAEGIGPTYYGFRELSAQKDPNFAADLVLERFDKSLDSNDDDLNQFKNWEMADDIYAKLNKASDRLGAILTDTKPGNILFKNEAGHQKVAATDFDPKFMVHSHLADDPGGRDTVNTLGSVAPMMFLERASDVSFTQLERDYMKTWYALYSKVMVLIPNNSYSQFYSKYGVASQQRSFLDLEKFIDEKMRVVMNQTSLTPDVDVEWRKINDSVNELRALATEIRDATTPLPLSPVPSD